MVRRRTNAYDADVAQGSGAIDGGEPPAAHLVVVGASAGGIDALATLVSTLPTDFPAPLVIAQHLDPARTSHLSEILAPRTTLPVRIVEDREVLERGVIYVIPADHHVEISGHEVQVATGAGADRGRPMPSVNLLLESAAEAFGENLVAVILTGTGSDGADGARRVKEHGGTVIIQNPQTASHPEMPLSLAPTTVDIVADLPAMGALLQELLAGTYTRLQPEDDRRLRGLLDQLRARTGIDFLGYKEPTIRRRLQRRLVDTASPTLEDYSRYLRRHPEEYQRLASSFLINVTDFFRDAEVFAYLREHTLPELIEAARQRGNELRLWSAGCATGEEAYSLAILLADVLGEAAGDFNVRIFATDLDGEAIAFARRGIYPASAIKNVPPHLVEHFFTHLDGAYEVKKVVRGMIVFGQHNLGQRAPFPRIDLALCRNVLIYFTPELQRRGLQSFAFALRDGGYLALGKAESTIPLPEHFTLVQPRLRIYRRQGQRLLLAQSHSKDATPIGLPAPLNRPALSSMERELARALPRQADTKPPAEGVEQVLQDLPIGVAVVDRHYDIQTINPTARRLLGIYAPAVGEDVVHQAARGLADPLRELIDAALAGRAGSGVYEVGSLPQTPGESHYLELVACPHNASPDRPEGNTLVLITVVDVTARERAYRERVAAAAEAAQDVERLRALLQESTASIRQLIQANEGLESSNATLRSTNEGLLVGNEESQAAMEEIETLTEEQQATNEELETLNEELQATVEELNSTNDELQARGFELQMLAESLEEERSRLAGILAGQTDGVLVVDREAMPVLTNEAFRNQFGTNLPPLQDARGRAVPVEASPQRRAARGEEFREPFTLGQGDGRRQVEVAGYPIRVGTVQGGVIVVHDVAASPPSATGAQ